MYDKGTNYKLLVSYPGMTMKSMWAGSYYYYNVEYYYYAIQQQISQAKNTTPYEFINKSMFLLVWLCSGNFSVDTTVIH